MYINDKSWVEYIFKDKFRYLVEIVKILFEYRIYLKI